MNPTTEGLVWLSVAAATWLAAAAVVAARTRDRWPAAGPPTTVLRDEPPAVVNLVTHGWRTTAEAVPATILDLVHRGLLGEGTTDDGREVLLLPAARSGLAAAPPSPVTSRAERLVLGHLRRRAGGGVVPPTAMEAGPDDASATWWRRFDTAVASDARQRGLVRPRLPVAIRLGFAAALVLLAWRFVALVRQVTEPDHQPEATALVVAMGLLGACVAVAATAPRHALRPTPAGLEAASHWLGVGAAQAEWLRPDGSGPVDLERYGSHVATAAALGLIPDRVRRLPLGAVDEQRAWSRRGGAYQPVVVRYPRWRPAWGRSPGAAIASGVAWTSALIVALLLLIRYGLGTQGWVSDRLTELAQPDDPERFLSERAIAWVALLAGTAVVAILLGLVGAGLVTGASSLVGGLADLVSERRCTGPVVRLRVRCRERDDRIRCERWLAIDPGGTDRVTAWRVRSELADQLREGDEVEVAVTTYLGFVRAVRVERPAAPHPSR